MRTRTSWWARSPAAPATARFFHARLARSLNPRARLSLSLLRLRAGVGVEGEGEPGALASRSLFHPPRCSAILRLRGRVGRLGLQALGRYRLSVGGSVFPPAFPLPVLRGRRGGVRPRDPPMGEKRRRRQRNNRAGA